MEIAGELLKKKNAKYWFIIFAISLITGLRSFGVIITSRLIYDERLYLKFYLVDELTGALSGFIMLPVVLWFFYKYPIRKDLLLTRIPIHFISSVIYGVGGTIIMTLSRQVLYPLFDMGEYNPGNIVFRFLMEYHKQLFWYMIIYAIFFAINSFRESQKQRIKASELQEELSKAKIHFLQSQINPHFLFNTLNMISSIMYDNPKDADKMIANLSDMLRKTLHNNKETHSLKRELELLKLYTDIMNARFHDKLRIEIVTDSQSQSAEVPWFFLQPIFENSIKHSSDYTNVCQIRMNSYVDKNNLKIEIMDNGPGLKNESEKIQQTGVGLSNIISRLEKIYGNYKFNMSNNPGGGLKVEIVIPYRKIDE